MSFLTAAKGACVRCKINVPDVFFSGVGRTQSEMIEAADEVVRDIVKAHDWRALTKQYQMVGDGTTGAFDLPSDYDRMPKGADVQRANWYTWGYVDTPDLNFWRDLKNGLASPNPGYWIMLDGRIQFQPAISADTTAEFYYISKNIVIDGDTGERKDSFQKDSDRLVLDESLLKLGLTWRWLEMNKLNYAEKLQDYEIRLSQISAEDRGARTIRMGRQLVDWNAQWAYPRNLGV